jgi:hypothetical protein
MPPTEYESANAIAWQSSNAVEFFDHYREEVSAPPSGLDNVGECLTQ